MITLEHIQLLEQKVHQAVERITALKEENASLKEKLSSYTGRIEELEVLIDSFKQDQGKIEEGILSALKQLDTIEQSVAGENRTAGEAEKTATSAGASSAGAVASSADAEPEADSHPEAASSSAPSSGQNSPEEDSNELKTEETEAEDDGNGKDGEEASKEAELDIF